MAEARGTRYTLVCKEAVAGAEGYAMLVCVFACALPTYSVGACSKGRGTRKIRDRTTDARLRATLSEGRRTNVGDERPRMERLGGSAVSVGLAIECDAGAQQGQLFAGHVDGTVEQEPLNRLLAGRLRQAA